MAGNKKVTVIVITQQQFDAAQAKGLLTVDDVVALLWGNRTSSAVARWLRQGEDDKLRAAETATPLNPLMLHGFKMYSEWAVTREEFDRWLTAIQNAVPEDVDDDQDEE